MDSDPANVGSGNSAQSPDVVELKVFSNLNSAELAKANLEARGIECWLTADDCGGMLAAMDTVRGVKLLVRSSDGAAAKELLAADSAAAEQLTPDEPASS